LAGARCLRRAVGAGQVPDRLLELRDVDRFYGRAHILHGLSFSIDNGEVAALLGRNGAGKSTTLKSIMHLMPAAAGQVCFDGVDISDEPSHRIAKLGIGYVPEDRRIFQDLTILENLDVGRQPARGNLSVWSCERLFGLFPNLAERRQHLGKEMSGGEQQMLSIARTLMGNPRLILLDEPSEGLAPVIVEQMATAISSLKEEGLTVLLSEQNLHFAHGVADRAYIIEKGTLRFEGTMQELNADEAIRDAYLSI
jgi:branched-chain amino acid transport system ATP-binding protein